MTQKCEAVCVAAARFQEARLQQILEQQAAAGAMNE